MNLVETAKPYEFKPENLYAATHRGSYFAAATSSQAFSIKERAMSKVKRLRRICKCGCKELIKPGNRYIFGHQSRGRNNPQYGKKGKDHPAYGRKHTEEAKCLIGNVHRGKVMSIETRNMLSEAAKDRTGEKNHMYGRKGKNSPLYGRKHSEESLKKMRGKNAPFYGKKFTKEHRRNLSKAHKCFAGENNPNWRGGISTEPYCSSWSDYEYKNSIKERDAYTCQNDLCWGTSNNLCLHHISYIKKDCRPTNLITLCYSCNSRANFNRGFWKKHYEEIIEEESKDG